MLLNAKVVSWSLGIFLALSYILCVVYGLAVPERLNGMKAMLEAALPASQMADPRRLYSRARRELSLWCIYRHCLRPDLQLY